MGIDEQQQKSDIGSASSKPSIFIVGAPDVGKRSILTRLTSSDIEDSSHAPSGISCHSWAIDTKYYTADVCIWLAHLCEKTAENAHKLTEQCDALVMVVDLTNLSSFESLKEWVSGVDLQNFEILLCVGNKTDLVAGHFAHSEYRRELQKQGESLSDTHPEFWDFGIDRNEGSSLLTEDENVSETIQTTCIDWCHENNIEYVEACAANATFDKCLSIDGDSQGIKRIWEALAAHMWPGMIMKSQDKTFAAVKSPKNEEFSDDESDYEIEYELLSNGSAEPFDGFEESWVSVENSKNLTKQGSDMQDFQVIKVPSSCEDNLPEASASNTQRDDSAHSTAAEASAYDSKSVTQNDSSVSQLNRENGNQEDVETEEKMDFAVEDLEQLMHEMAYMRENLRLMPDSHRREIAGRLAMKMASMFVDDKDADSV